MRDHDHRNLPQDIKTVLEKPSHPPSRGQLRRDAIRKQVIVTVLRRQGLTQVEAEEQFEAGVR